MSYRIGLRKTLLIISFEHDMWLSCKMNENNVKSHLLG